MKSMKSTYSLRKKKQYLFIGGWLLCGCLLFILPAIAITADEIVEKMSQQQKLIQDFRALIYQTVTINGREKLEQFYTGWVSARKTNSSNWNRFKYETIEPSSEKLLQVYDGKSLWTYYPSLSQVTQQELEGFLPGMALGIFPGELRRDFSFKLLGEEKVGERKSYRLEMLPKLKGLEAYHIELWVDTQKWIPNQIKVVDPWQQVTTTEIKEIQFDTGLKEEEFLFVRPSGTEITRIGIPEEK